MNSRELGLLVAVLTAFAGLVVASVPGVASAVGVPAELPLLLAVVAVVGAIVRGRTWLGHDDVDYRPVERERPTGTVAPGADFDGMLRRAPARPTRGGNTRLIVIRQSLREAAVETLVTYQGYTETSARRALDAGTWTDDEYAAEFFTATDGGGTLSESITASFYGDAPFERRADRAARAIERLAGRDR